MRCAETRNAGIHSLGKKNESSIVIVNKTTSCLVEPYERTDTTVTRVTRYERVRANVCPFGRLFPIEKQRFRNIFTSFWLI